MSDINLSSAVRSSLSSLQSTASLLSSTQERLATGNRVNSALDDPTAFFTAAALTDRANDLSTLLDEQGQAIQVIETADQGISAISDLVESARSIATQALQTDDASERATLAGQFDDILGQISDLAGDASFNGINLLDSANSSDLEVIFNEDSSSSLTVGGFNFTDVQTGLGLSNQSNGGVASTATLDISGLADGDTLTISSGADGASDVNVTIDDGAVTGVDATVTLDLSTVTLAAGDTLSIDVGGTTVTTAALGASPDADAVRTAVSTAISDAVTNGDIVATDLASSGSGNDLTLTSESADISVTFNDADAANTTVTSGASGVDGDGTAFVAEVAADLSAANIQSQISSAITTANATAATGLTATESGGTITLSSTVGTVSSNEGGTSNSTAGTAFVAGNGGSDFATNDDINNALAAIDSALGTLRTSASTLGTNLSTIQIRSDFTENLIDTLEVGAGNLTLADLNEEGANLLTLQTRQALSSTSLSFATQAEQSVLSLF